jgi:hypothetical protein
VTALPDFVLYIRLLPGLPGWSFRGIEQNESTVLAAQSGY